jgi:hypothetical protein
LIGGLLADASYIAPTYAVGTNDGGYVLAADGYWWYNGNAYNRVTTYYSSSYYVNGVCYPPGPYYRYVFSHAQPALTYNDPQWRSKLLDIAAQRDKVEGDVRKSAFEQAYFLDSVKTLGLEGNFKWQNYGYAPPYGYGSSGSLGYGSALQLSTAGANGSTVYGYSYNQQASIYGEDLGAYMTMADRQVQAVAKILADANANFTDRIGQAGEEQNRVAQVIAKGKVLEQVLKSLDTKNSTVNTQVYSYKATVGKDGKVQVENQPNAPGVGDTRKQFEALAVAKCASCHTGADAKGKFDVTQYPAMTPGQKLHVLERLTTQDATKVMPRDAGDALKPGVRLTDAEIQLWMIN